MTEEALRGVELLLWLTVLVITARPFFRLLLGRPVKLDAIWGMVFFGTSNRLLFTAIVLWMPESEAARDAAHLMAMMVATTVILARYMRAGETS